MNRSSTGELNQLKKEELTLAERNNIIKNIGIFVAWPYCNGPRHIGHAAALVPADVMARFRRAEGHHVMMVSGTDEYGTPNQIAAQKNNQEPKLFVNKTSGIIRQDFIDLGMSFDWFTRTTTSTHEKVAQIVFSQLADTGYISQKTMLGSFDQITGDSLPDRFVEGVCPRCNQPGARGDQCDKCGYLLEPNELLNPTSKNTGNPVEFKPTVHYFLNLDMLKSEVAEYLANNNNLRKEAKNMSENMVAELRPRAITRDLKWGIPLPTQYEIENEPRVLYVWFEAVIGYLSASIEWSNTQNDKEAWKDYWSKDAQNYYVMGKDNIPFHTIIWPAIISALNNSNSEFKDNVSMPQTVLSTGNLNFGNDKFSSSRGNVVYIKDLIEHIGPDALRFYLISAGPENSDSSFTFESIVTKTNNELIAKWGNLISRTANLIKRDCDSVVPERCNPTEADKNLLELAKKCYQEVGDLLSKGKFSVAINKALDTVAVANKYIYDEKPWNEDVISSGRNKEVLATLCLFIENMNRILCPFIPHSSQKINDIFGDDTLIAPMPKTEYGLDGQSVLSGDYSQGLTWEYAETWSGNKISSEKPVVFNKLNLEQLKSIFSN
jgi:methionyl-tRNA synthetase